MQEQACARLVIRCTDTNETELVFFFVVVVSEFASMTVSDRVLDV